MNDKDGLLCLPGHRTHFFYRVKNSSGGLAVNHGDMRDRGFLFERGSHLRHFRFLVLGKLKGRGPNSQHSVYFDKTPPVGSVDDDQPMAAGRGDGTQYRLNPKKCRCPER